MSLNGKTKVIYILSEIDKALAFEWISTNLDKSKFDLSFILLNSADSVLERFLYSHKIKTHRITYTGKKDIVQAFFKVLKILKKEKPDVIHAHLFAASLVGLFAGKVVGIKKRVYTRHHSSLHHVYYPRAVFYDKIINSLATDIVSITSKVTEILTEKEGVSPEKISLIHHGFQLNDFQVVGKDRVQALKVKYNPENKRPVIGVIARYTHWKGIQYTIEGFKKLLLSYPNALLVLANASGDFADEIKKQLNEIPSENYKEIKFENDIMALYRLFDVYVHVPIDDHSEAFGQTYVEALAVGVPSVFTLSGVATEFIQDRKNALVVPFKDANAIYEATKALLENETLRTTLIDQGKQDVSRKFALSKMINSLETLYES